MPKIALHMTDKNFPVTGPLERLMPLSPPKKTGGARTAPVPRSWRRQCVTWLLETGGVGESIAAPLKSVERRQQLVWRGRRDISRRQHDVTVHGDRSAWAARDVSAASSRRLQFLEDRLETRRRPETQRRLEGRGPRRQCRRLVDVVGAVTIALQLVRDRDVMVGRKAGGSPVHLRKFSSGWDETLQYTSYTASPHGWYFNKKHLKKCWAHSPLRAVLHCHSPGVATVSRRHCRTPPAHRCPRQQQRQRVTEGTAMAP